MRRETAFIQDPESHSALEDKQAAEYLDLVISSVRYGSGLGGFSLARPRLYTGPGGICHVIPGPPSAVHPYSFPGWGHISYNLFLIGTPLGSGWGRGLSGDRGRECGKRHPAPGG